MSRLEDDVATDLELNTVISAMSRGDGVIADVAREALLASLTDIDTILYRQSILRDCIENADCIRTVYDLAVETLDTERTSFLFLSLGRTPGSVLFRAVDVLEMLYGMLSRLRHIADQHGTEFASPGLRRFFAMVQAELNDAYLERMREHLRRLRFRGAVVLSAQLGSGNKGSHYVLRTPLAREQNWLGRAIRGRTDEAYSFTIPAQDEEGMRALAALTDQGKASVANAVAQSTDHVLAFFSALRTELAFYVGCLNLRSTLLELGAPTCEPQPLPANEYVHRARGLYDPSLALTKQSRVVANDLSADDKRLVIVTGANRGGKSSFLRSVGVAQLMMQCGMFVAADHWQASICAGVFTHYKREEDDWMKRGKLDEELARMSVIVDDLRANSLVLLNESFASTNENEGAEIAHQVVRALIERRIVVYYVTHQYEFARTFVSEGRADVLFLLAERREDGSRTFRIEPGMPLPTSYAKDLYERILGGPQPTFARDSSRPG